MGIAGALVRGLYRAIRYGRQIGKTAANGTKVYRRGGVTTAINKSGKVTRTVEHARTGKYRYDTKATDYLPFGEPRTTKSSVVRDGKNWESISVCADSKTVPGGRDMTHTSIFPDGTFNVTIDKTVSRNGNYYNQRTTKTGKILDKTM